MRRLNTEKEYDSIKNFILTRIFPRIFFSIMIVSYIIGGTLKGKVNGTMDGVVVIVEGVVDGLEKTPLDTIPINQKNMDFIPAILSTTVGSTVCFPNQEEVIYHHVFSITPGNEFDIGTYRAGVNRSVHFDKTGIVEVFCSIHTRMYAVVVVVDHPFHSGIDKNDEYEIQNIPPGEYTVKAIFANVKNQEISEKQQKVVIQNENSESEITILNFDER